jgi:hypothetical protein
MKWYAKLLELFRRQAPINLEKSRQLAFVVTLGAADLAGIEPPDGLEDMNTAEVLRVASRGLVLAQARVQRLNQQVDLLQRAATAGATESAPRLLADVTMDSPDIAGDIIEILDHLASWPKDSARRWLEDRLGRIAMKCEISWIEDSGPLDLTRHEVIGVQRATDAHQPGDIAATIRPGYSQYGRVIRPQQVIAFAEDHDS